MHLHSAGALVIVASLEVGGGAVEVKGRQSLERLAIDADRELALLVADLIGEALADGDVVDVEALLTAGTALLDAHLECSLGVVVELCHGLCGDGIVNVDLADASFAPVLCNLEIAKETVLVAFGAPFGGVALTQLRAAVLAVGSCDAARVGGTASHLEDESSIAFVGVEILRVAIALASLKLTAGDGSRATGAANRKLELPLGEIKVASRSTVGVESSNLGSSKEYHEAGRREDVCQLHDGLYVVGILKIQVCTSKLMVVGSGVCWKIAMLSGRKDIRHRVLEALYI